MDVRRVTAEYEAWLARRVTLVASALDRKHELMSKGAFTFLRGTFYWWARRWPEVCPELARAPRILAVGDLHVENFGTWRDAEGRLIWGVNDFDEASPCAYAQDLVRLATSALLAKEEGHLAIAGRDACAAIEEGYARALVAGGRPFVLEEEHAWLRELALAAARDPGPFWDKLGKFPKLKGGAPPKAINVIEQLLPEPRLPYELHARIAGVGSLGLQRILALADWRGGRIAREAKARVQSALAWAEGRSDADHYSEIVERAVRVPDPLLRVGDGWLGRRLAPHCARVELETLPKQRDEARLLHAMGAETANVHLGDRAGAGVVAKDLRGRTGEWLHDAARRMAGVVIAGAEEWRRAQTEGGSS
jgi:hypothetical protein